jgi:hypothetical protein
MFIKTILTSIFKKSYTQKTWHVLPTLRRRDALCKRPELLVQGYKITSQKTETLC